MSDKNYLGYNVERLETAPAFLPYSKVIAWYDDENAFVAGDDSGRVLTVDLPFATQAIVDKMLERIKGYSYQPWTGSGAILDPAAELGDGVTVNGVYSVLASAETSFDALMVSDAAAPADEEVDHEYPYVPPTDRALKRKVTLGAAYHGVSITRTNGIEVTQYDAEGNAQSRAKLNGDVFALYDDDGSEALYFDVDAGKFMFRGILNVADNFLVDKDGNVTINGNINLSGGTITWGKNDPSTDLPDYLHSTYIGPTVIRSPTIEANEFNVQPSDTEDYTGSFNIYGIQLGETYHMLQIAYQGYNAAVTPYVDISSPGGADLRFNYGNQGVSPIQFYGTVDFTNATVLGLTASGGEGLSGETVTIKATHQVKITASDDINVQSDEDVNFSADYDIVFSAIQSNDEEERVSMRLSADYQRIHFSIGSTVWVLDETGLWKL